MQEITDDILTKAAEGDLSAFKVIYKAASGFVYNVAYRVVGNKEDAEEVTQEVFLTVYRKLKDFRFQSSFKTWAYRIAVNSAINYSKRFSKEKRQTVEFDENQNVLEHPNEAAAKIDLEHNKEKLNSLLAALNPEHRACIVLRSMEGLSYQEIAVSLGININTVRSRLKRAREALLVLGKEVIRHEL